MKEGGGGGGVLKVHDINTGDIPAGSETMIDVQVGVTYHSAAPPSRRHASAHGRGGDGTGCRRRRWRSTHLYQPDHI